MERQNNNFDDIQALVQVFPEKIRSVLEEKGHYDQLLEIVLDTGRIPLARYTGGDEELSAEEVSSQDIDSIVSQISSFDLDNRAGMERTLHRISAIRNRKGKIVGLTCRVGRAVFGTLEIIEDFIESGRSILILGKPGIGKTTMLREAARVLAETKRVVIVDTSNEIGGDGDVPHPAVGKARRMQVAKPALQHEVMIEAVENHNPEVIIIDEIGRELEAVAARTIAERGVQLIGTAHGRSLGNLLMNPTLSDLIGGIESVTLSDEEAKRRGTQKTVLERRSPPTFDVLVEIQERNQVIVYADVAEAVDALLRGIPLQPELRRRNANGDIIREKAPAPILEGAGFSGANGGNNAHAAGNSLFSDRQEPSRQRSNMLRISQKSRFENASAHRQTGDPFQDTFHKESASDLLKDPQWKNDTLHIFAHGVTRSRLNEAASQLQVPVTIVNNLEEANIMMTLRPYYRDRQPIIIEAEERNMPIYVLRSNTTSQIANTLANLFKVQVRDQAVNWTDAKDETESAIRAILNGEVSWVDLSPADREIRRLQHEMVEQANLISQSFGKEPKRRLRIYRNI